MNARTSLFTSLAIAAGLGLAGCGGSSNNNDDAGDTPPRSYDVTLGDGHGLEAGTTALASGETTVDGTTLTCTPAEGSTGCSLTVTRNDVLGTHTATATGGMVTVTPPTPPTPPEPMVSLPLPDGHNVRDRLDQDDEDQTDRFRDGKYLDIRAGGNINYGGVRFACPADADGGNCRVTFTVGLNDDSVEATTGGEGNGTATAILLSTEAVGTDVGLATLREEITKGPAPSPSALSKRLGYPEADTQRDANTPFRSGHMTTPKSTGHEAATAKAWHGGPWRGVSWEPTSSEISVRFDNQAPLMTFAEKYGLNRGNANDVSIEERLFGDGISDTDAARASRREDFWNLVRATEDTGRAGAGPVPVVRGAPGADLYRLPVTFDGVPGILSCATDCGTITSERITEGGAQVGKLRGPTDDDDEGDGWTFTATSSTATVAGLGDREDYLAFGWWRKNDSPGGGFSDFEPIYGGRIPFMYVDSGNDSLEGKATYVGGAAGNYTYYGGHEAPATNPAASGDDPADRPDRHGGWFVADAELEAEFNFQDTQDTGTETDTPDKISGMIKNFRGQHGSLGAWQVKLDSTPLTVDTNSTTPVPVEIATPATAMNTSGNADGENWQGRWGGSFFGESAKDHSRLPSGVAGWFHAATGTEYLNASGGVVVRYDGAVGVAVQGSFAAPRKP